MSTAEVCPCCGQPLDAAARRRLQAGPTGSARRPAVSLDQLPPPDPAAAASARAAPATPGQAGPSRDLGVQTLLAGAGATLLAVAAIVFTAVTWEQLPGAARGAVLAAATGLAAAGTRRLSHRGLGRTAEATAVLTMALGATTLLGLWRLDVASLGVVPGSLVSAVVGSLLVAGAFGLERLAAVRAPRRLAAWLVAVPPVGLGVWIGDLWTASGPGGQAATAAGLLGAAAAVALNARRRLVAASGWRRLTYVLAALLWLAGVVVAVADLVRSGEVLVGPLTAAAAVIATAVVLPLGVRRWAGADGLARWWDPGGAAGGWFAAAAGAVVTTGAITGWDRPGVAAVVALLAAAAGLAVTGRAARGGAVAGATPVWLFGAVAALDVPAWLTFVWTGRVAAPWRAELLATAPAGPGTVDLAVAAAAAGAVCLALAALGLRRMAGVAAAVTVIGLVLGAVWPVAPVWAPPVVLVAVSAALGAGVVTGTGPPAGLVGGLIVATGAAAGAALATPAATVATLAALTVLLATVAERAPGRRRPAPSVTAGVTWLGTAGAAAAAATDEPAVPGVVLLVAAGALVVVADLILARRPRTAGGLETVGWLGGGAAIAVVWPAGPAWQSVVLGGIAVATAAQAALREDRRWLAWASSLAASATSWVLLDAAGVAVVEAYTLPPAALTGLIGARRLATDPALSSWRTLAAPLALAITPTLWQLIDDPGDLARLAAGLVGAVVLTALGRWRGLAAPVVYGAAAGVVVAGTQVTVAAEHLPRWVLLALAGGILLWTSVTYEAQRRRLTAASRHVAALR